MSQECPDCKRYRLIPVKLECEGCGFPFKIIKRFFYCTLCGYQSIPEIAKNEN